MKRSMRKIRFLLEVFSTVTTCVVIAVAVFTTVLDPAEELDPVILWQIPAVSFLCALSCMIYPWDRSIGKKEMGIRVAVQYLLINIIVMLAGYWFYWYNINHLQSILVMLFSIAVIFSVVFVLSWTRDAGEARRMNTRLKEYQEKKQNP